MDLGEDTTRSFVAAQTLQGAAAGAAAGSEEHQGGSGTSNGGGAGQRPGPTNGSSGQAPPAPLPPAQPKNAKRAQQQAPEARSSSESTPAMELSFKQGLPEQPRNSSFVGFAPRHHSSDGSDHAAPLLQRRHAQTSGSEAAEQCAAAPGRNISTGSGRGPLTESSTSSTHNPLFVMAGAGAGAGAGLGPLPGVRPSAPPYRTVSVESADLLNALPTGQGLAGRSPGSTPRGLPRSESMPAERLVVQQHCVAGDLHLPAPVAAAAGGAVLAALSRPAGSPKGAGAGTACGDTAGGWLLGGSRGPTPRPSHAGSEGRAAASQRPAQEPAMLSGSSEDGMYKDEYNFDDGHESSKPWYKRRRVWKVAILLSFSLFFICLGTAFVVLNANENISFDASSFEVWRLCFFLAGLPIIWLLGDLFTRVVVYGVEKTMFTWRNVLYFVYSVRRPATNVIRAAATLGWWAGMMTIGNQSMNSTLNTAYDIILKLWACVTLFMTANLLKTLLAKMLSSKFNKHSHLQKMHESLRKEHMLHTLLQPRPKPQLSQGEAAGDNADACGGKGLELEGEEPHTPPRRSVSEGANHQLGPGAEHGPAAAEGARSPKRASSLPAAGGQPKAARGSFKLMLNFLRRGKQLTTIKEEPGREGSESVPSPPQPPPPPRQQPRELEDISIHSQSCASTPRKAVVVGASGGGGLFTGGGSARELSAAGGPPRSPASAKAASSPARPPRSPRWLEHEHSGEGRLSRQSSQSQHTRATGGHRALKRTASMLAGNRRGAGMARDSKTSRQEGRQAEALAVAVSDSLSERRNEILAEKLVKMEKYIRKNALQITFKDELTRTERRERVTSEMEAKKLAFYLFWNVKANFSSREVTMDDLRSFFPEQGAQRAYEWLDDNQDGIIDLQDVCATVVKIFKERENLAASLKDTKTVVGKLETLIGFMLHFVFIFLYLAIFNIDVMQAYLAVSSLVLAFSFIFSQSLRQLYENVVFLFVIHPYDIGDTLIVDNETHKVDEINLQFTTLLNSSNAKVFYPNQKLMNAPFINLSTSGNKGESFKVLVDLDTPGTVLDEIRAVAEEHIRAHPLEFSGTLGVNFNTSANPLKMTLSVYYEYAHNGVDGGRCNRTRNKLYTLLAETLGRLGVRYSWPEIRERFVGAPPGTEKARAEAVLGAAAVGAGEGPLADESKVKVL